MDIGYQDPGERIGSGSIYDYAIVWIITGTLSLTAAVIFLPIVLDGLSDQGIEQSLGQILGIIIFTSTSAFLYFLGFHTFYIYWGDGKQLKKWILAAMSENDLPPLSDVTIDMQDERLGFIFRLGGLKPNFTIWIPRESMMRYTECFQGTEKEIIRKDDGSLEILHDDGSISSFTIEEKPDILFLMVLGEQWETVKRLFGERERELSAGIDKEIPDGDPGSDDHAA
jgi:hypothetical protein